MREGERVCDRGSVREFVKGGESVRAKWRESFACVCVRERERERERERDS